jgi:hypothetical protein
MPPRTTTYLCLRAAYSKYIARMLVVQSCNVAQLQQCRAGMAIVMVMMLLHCPSEFLFVNAATFAHRSTQATVSFRNDSQRWGHPASKECSGLRDTHRIRLGPVYLAARDRDEDVMERRQDKLPVRVQTLEVDPFTLAAVGFSLIAFNFFILANLGDGGIAGTVATIMNKLNE